MPRKSKPVSLFVCNFSNWDMLMKKISENIHDYDQINEEDKNQKSFEEANWYAKIDIKDSTDKRSIEYIRALIISEIAGKTIDEVKVDQINRKLSVLKIGKNWILLLESQYIK